MKRLTFEAQTYLIAVLRQGLDQPDDSQPKKIPFAERSTRMEALKRRLSGVSIKGEYEPAHVLLEKACAMFDQNLVKYLEPSVCISRAYEVQGSKQTRELAFEKGSIVLKNQDEKLSTVTNTLPHGCSGELHTIAPTQWIKGGGSKRLSFSCS